MRMLAIYFISAEFPLEIYEKDQTSNVFDVVVDGLHLGDPFECIGMTNSKGNIMFLNLKLAEVIELKEVDGL